MSLFKIRDFWNIQCGHGEEFNQFSIHVTNIDNSPNNSDKIIVGSHSGILRIYGLRSSKLSTDQLNVDELGYDENDCLVEMQFPLPILQVKSGILLSASDKRQLLILFPKKFGVYSVTSNEGLSEYGFSYSITTLYEHELQRMAFCVTIGTFGQVKGREFVCVQSLDGSLMFFEQETVSFMRTMSNSLLPTSFAYLPTTDTFLIQSADWTLQCFRYQMLAISAHQDEKNNKSLRKVVPDWSFELGEQVLEIETICLESNASLIVVLGERNLFVLRSDGTMYWQKKFLDYRPVYCHSYFACKGKPSTDSSTRSGQSNSAGQEQKQVLLERDLVILLITETSCLIYNERRLKWACQLPRLYCQVQRANFYFTTNCQLIGCLTLLSSDGHLALAYLGTNPSLNIVNTPSSRMNRRQSSKASKQNTFSSEDKEELFRNTQKDKAEFDKELNELRKIINAYNSDFNSLIKLNSGKDGPTQKEDNDLSVELVNFKFDTVNNWSGKQIKLDKLQSNNVIDLEFNLDSSKQLSNLTMSLNTSNCFNITPHLHSILKLESTDNNFQFRLFYDSLNRLVSFRSNLIFFVINYFNEQNLPRIYTKLIELPVSFFCRLQNQSLFSRTGSSTSSSASQRSLRGGVEEPSLDHYLSDNLIKQTNIGFQFYSRTKINLTSLFLEIINHHNLNDKPAKKLDEESSNKITIQFLNSKLKIVHVEFILPNDETGTDDKSYRAIINGDDLHSNCFVFNLLITKLHQLQLDKTIDKLLFNRSSIPMKEYFELIDQHLTLRQKMSARKRELEEHCERLRVVEKRILIKLKDRNISNLNNLESLFNVQHQKVMSLANEILNLEQDFDDESIRLNCCNQLICLILRCVGNLNDEENQLIEGSFNILPFVQTNDLEAWQERTELSLSFLLRNHLKNTLDISKGSNFELVQPDDTDNLFKLIKMVIEKCQRGFAATSNNKNNLESKTIIEVDEET